MSASLLQRFPAREDFLGHPKGVYVCFFTEMWERFSFYGMKALLLLYLTKYHLFGDEAGYDLLGAYGGLVYCMPVIGGAARRPLAGHAQGGGVRRHAAGAGPSGHGVRRQRRRATSAAWWCATKARCAYTYLSLALIIMGVGFLKPNISTIVGKLYAENDPRRDSGFSLFYAGINLGALFASLVCGYLGETLGWKYGFGAAGIGMLLGLAMFLWGQKYLHGHAEPREPASLRERVLGLPREWLIYLRRVARRAADRLADVGVGQRRLRAGRRNFAGADADAGRAGGGAGLVRLVRPLAMHAGAAPADARADGDDLHGLVFFTLYEQTYGSWVTFTDRLLTKDIVPSLVAPLQRRMDCRLGTNLSLFVQTAPWSTCSLLAPLSFMLAARLSDRNPDSATPRLLFIAVTVVMLVCLVRDCVVLPQTAGSLTYLGALLPGGAGAGVRGAVGVAGHARTRSVQAVQDRRWD